MTNQYSTMLLLSRLQSELNRLFSEFMEFDEGNLVEGDWSPRIDVVESRDAIVILAAVPGMGAADVKLEIAGNLVTLSGHKRNEGVPGPGGQLHRKERGEGRFVRKIQLVPPVNTLRACAKLANGLLTVSFPKVEDQRQKIRVLEIVESEDRSDE
jgi:HSP20 family protein